MLSPEYRLCAFIPLQHSGGYFFLNVSQLVQGSATSVDELNRTHSAPAARVVRRDPDIHHHVVCGRGSGRHSLNSHLSPRPYLDDAALGVASYDVVHATEIIKHGLYNSTIDCALEALTRAE